MALFLLPEQVRLCGKSFFFLRKGPGFYYFRGTFPRVLMTNLPSLLRLFGPFALAQQRRSRRSFYFPVAA
ncbi:hypothetical protein HMPREF1246_1915 [Acidaminococcus sp. BV3L6]|nr:hypothetical protein HMPREF1246_1915 [Acidaminococcus sp. BV3L6]